MPMHSPSSDPQRLVNTTTLFWDKPVNMDTLVTLSSPLLHIYLNTRMTKIIPTIIIFLHIHTICTQPTTHPHAHLSHTQSKTNILQKQPHTHTHFQSNQSQQIITSNTQSPEKHSQSPHTTKRNPVTRLLNNYNLIHPPSCKFKLDRYMLIFIPTISCEYYKDYQVTKAS